MKVDTILPNLKDQYNIIISHPLQSYEWGEFREKTGVKLIRKGIFDGNKLVDGFQLTIHKLPLVPWTIGYLPKGGTLNLQMLADLIKIGKENHCLFIKIEPHLKKKQILNLQLKNYDLKKSKHPLFTKYTFMIDLTKPEEELLKQMQPKTRYNVRLAERKGVKVIEDNSPAAFEEYLKLLKETTKRQKFYAHSENYHRQMWETLQPAGIAHLLKAVYQNQTLVIWIVFLFHKKLYYPYGVSSSEHREVMASNKMLWEAILWGKRQGAKLFDLWGSLGPEPDKNNPWYGFHRFKEGYGGELVELIGSYDLVIKPQLYHLYNFAYTARSYLLHQSL